MTRRRSWIAAAQAAVVGVLLVVVFLTLLQPQGSGPLFGVDMPATPPGVPGAHASRPGEHRAPQASAPGGQGGGSTSAPSAGSQQPSGAASAPTGPSPPATPPPATPALGEQDQPTGDQYDDTLARLAARLG